MARTLTCEIAPQARAVFFLVVVFSCASAQTPDPPDSSAGWLVLHGGRLVERTVAARFAALAGLPVAPLVVIPTAHGLKLTPMQLEGLKEGATRTFHTTNVIVLHARTRKEADSEAFVEPLHSARGVWITGGEDRFLMSIYAGTRTVRELAAVYARGGVVGGGSAGASVLTSFKILLPASLQPNGGRIRKGEIGFGLLKNTAVHPHFTQRHRENQMRLLVLNHPEVLFLGIDEDTAAIVHSGEFEVMGPGKVFACGGKTSGDQACVSLSAGQTYHLKP
jgi:cyanophycinase